MTTLSQTLMGQGFHLFIESTDGSYPKSQEFRQLSDIYKYLHNQQNIWQEKGFLAASFDSTSVNDSIIKTKFFKGEKYEWADIDFSNIPKDLWGQLNIREEDWQRKIISPQQIANLHSKILNYFENNGYPFVQTYLDSFVHNEKGMKAKLFLDKGFTQKVDTIIIEGTAEIALEFIQNYLSIHQGDFYNESKMQQISKRLQQLPFLKESKPWRIDFTIDQNKLFLFLNNEKANQINGIIGLQPNTESTGKFLLTADLLLSLKNSLGYGETIEATYQNLEAKSPKFLAHVIAPYLFNSPFGLEGNFDLYKKDTTYRNVIAEGGLRYQLGSEEYVKIFYQINSNRLITADTAFAITNHKLPEHIDLNGQGFGIAFDINRTDYLFNPQKGILANLTFLANRRKVIQNDAILAVGRTSGIDFKKLYEEANENKYQFKLNANISWYFPLYKMLTGKIAYRGGYFYGKNLFQNELFRIGGFSTLRGFDENSFYANQYHIATAEIHFGLGGNSFFYLFSDNAFVETKFQNTDQKDLPVSFGVGTNLENKTGVFKIALGIGKHSGQPFGFRNTKVHFGYAAYF